MNRAPTEKPTPVSLWSSRCDGGTWIPAFAGMTSYAKVSLRGNDGTRFPMVL